jgi:small subunit ribosomal protein S17
MRRKINKMGKQKEFTGVVVSDKMQKTVVVKTMHLTRHAKYSKTIKLHNKFKAHDEKGIAKLGDTVRIVETRPLSKDKRFMVKEVLKKAEKIQVAAIEETL